jgi:hypothetical protein
MVLFVFAIGLSFSITFGTLAEMSTDQILKYLVWNPLTILYDVYLNEIGAKNTYFLGNYYTSLFVLIVEITLSYLLAKKVVKF